MTAAAEPTREEIDARPGATVLEFGAEHCPHCRAAQASIATALARHPRVAHFRIEDGPGRRLGRSFRIKLWPTLVFMQQGRELARLVRPTDPATIEQALAQIDAAA